MGTAHSAAAEAAVAVGGLRGPAEATEPVKECSNAMHNGVERPVRTYSTT